MQTSVSSLSEFGRKLRLSAPSDELAIPPAVPMVLQAPSPESLLQAVALNAAAAARIRMILRSPDTGRSLADPRVCDDVVRRTESVSLCLWARFGPAERPKHGAETRSGRATFSLTVKRSLLGFALLCVGSLAVVSGCGEDDDGRTVRANIGPSGGQISSHDGVLTVLILPGALDTTHEFSVAPSDTPPLIFGPAYRVQPDVPLSVNAEITYARTLPNDPTGTGVAAIRKEDFEAGSATWIKLPTVELDVNDDLVTATDSEVSLFYGLLQGDDVSGTTSTTTATTDPTNDTDDPSASETGSESGDDTSGPLSHAADIRDIWTNNCLGMGCHSPGQSSPDLETDPYTAIVGVMPLSAAVPYITAGDPQTSYLMHKLDATHALEANLGGCGCGGAGGPMPAGASLLDESVRDMVRSWIEQGAPE